MPDPQGSRAVLVGVSRYTTLESLPGVTNNLPALATALSSGSSWALPPGHCTVVAEPSTAVEMLDPIAEAAEAARDTLLVYFCGHGLTDSRGELLFGLPGARPGWSHTGVAYQALRDVIATGRARRYVIILDCCLSGRALGLMNSPADLLADQAVIEGSYLLAAAPENGAALAPPGETYTAFTGELLHVLENGIDGEPAELDLETVYRHLRTTLRAKGRPEPQKRDRNTAGRLMLARNRSPRPGPGAHSKGDDARWPNPETFLTPRMFLDGLTQARILSGRKFRDLSARSQPHLEPGAFSRLVNLNELPKTWRTTGIFLAACGLTEQQCAAWKASWTRLKTEAAAHPQPEPGPPAAPAQAPRPRRRWRRPT
ncbi:caspase family protein [Actinacidiphila glaucinigra]|uniref:caspase family protein n=1 Tax=Actinacidiphila glaucinigra TaxID=235986 RepID=UPI002DDB7178|nr:caspase family protein [Actinacidiphila glaucinigra]WSD65098.1 caspase family protein [Actinacidiphila glaucinigra]